MSDAAGTAAAPSIPCPTCKRPTQHLKCVRLGTVVFVVIGVATRFQQRFGCPDCIRGEIGRFALVNLLTANLAWPIAVLPWTLISLRRSYQPGHSPEVLEQVGIPAASQPAPASPILGGVVRIGAGLAAVAAALALTGPWWYQAPSPVVAALGGGVLCGLGARWGYIGAKRLTGAVVSGRPTWIVAAAALVGYLMISAPLASGYWRWQERKATRLGYPYDYVHHLPPQVWTIDMVKKFVDWRVGQLHQAGPGDFARRELMFLSAALAAHRPDDPEFQELARQVAAELSQVTTDATSTHR